MAGLCALAVSPGRPGPGEDRRPARSQFAPSVGARRDTRTRRAGRHIPRRHILLPLCHDTGYLGAELCECLKREYKSELTRELSGLLRDGGETFADFRADYYSAEPDSSGVPPREIMKFVYNYCREYAANFSL